MIISGAGSATGIGSSFATGSGGVTPNAISTRRALFSANPGSAAIRSIDASLTPCTLPNACRSARRLFGPMPGMRSSSDVSVRAVRFCRWKVIAKRCASSRACCNIRNAGESLGYRMGSLRTGRKISSSRLARLISATDEIPSASSAARAAFNCPFPPSMTARSGSCFCSLTRRSK